MRNEEKLYHSFGELIYAVANALHEIGTRESNEALVGYAGALKNALIETVDSGTITADLRGKSQAAEVVVVDMHQFLAAVDDKLDQIITNR